MAFFKFRKGGDDQTTTAPQPESVEVMRRRARHRLIGAVVLVLAGVIGFPLLVDKQPRPIAVDIPIEIPDKAKVKPLVAAPAPQAQPAASAPPAAAPVAAVKPEAKAEVKAELKTEPKPEPKVEAKPAEKVADKPVEKPAEKAPADSGAKAQALLEGKDAPKEQAKTEPAKTAAAATDDRYIVQVGAFADVTKAREVRLKVERAGMKTYTHVVETKEGRRIRVRVGPFANKAEADKAAEKIKKLDLPAAILTL
ncbi:MAG: SPOR domain-containing protein [Hylemonella sp.]|nr:SPOR domain-containing protein [Hylemonella sp.]MDP1937261.1 SPOR domain-containing protein [Hylemonella sp.]